MRVLGGKCIHETNRKLRCPRLSFGATPEVIMASPWAVADPGLAGACVAAIFGALSKRGTAGKSVRACGVRACAGVAARCHARRAAAGATAGDPHAEVSAGGPMPRPRRVLGVREVRRGAVHARCHVRGAALRAAVVV